MTTAGHHRKGLTRGRGLAYLNLLGRCIDVRPPSPQARAAEVATASGRYRHHAEHHAALFDQCNIDGELFTARNEFLGAIQRVYQPPALPAGTHALIDIGVLFRQHWNAWVQRGEACENEMMGSQVGSRHGRIIRLGRHGYLGTPVRQDGFTRLPSQFNDRCDKRVA